VEKTSIKTMFTVEYFLVSLDPDKQLNSFVWNTLPIGLSLCVFLYQQIFTHVHTLF